MIEKVRETIKSRGLVKRGDKILVGLSGGADSVCLTHVLCSLREELGIDIMCAHVNHGIRGKDADSDEKYAVGFSKSLGIECVVKTVDIPALSKELGVSEETAGRNARYKFFAEMLKKYGFDKIATAHNLNDSAETIVMNFMRGSSLSGLSGIPHRRGDIIRPLLDVTREEIEEYCRENGLSYVTDKTNFRNIYTRNKVRNILIPLIEREFNPDFKATAVRNAALIESDAEFLDDAAEKKYAELVSEGAIGTRALIDCPEPIARRIVRKMAGNVTGREDLPADFTKKILELAKKNRTGSIAELPDGAAAVIEYGRLYVKKAEEENAQYEYALPLGEDVFIREAGVIIRADAADARENDGAQYFSGADDMRVRSRRAGDSFYPAGMSGKKKLKDYFIDEKIPRRERNTVPVITSGGEIMYIVGKRRDRRFAFNGRGIKITVREP